MTKILKPTLLIVLLAFSPFAQATEKEFKVGEFNKLEIGWAFDVEIKQSNRNYVSVNATDEIMEKVRIEVTNNTLIIKYDMEKKSWRSKEDEAKVYIEFKSLEEIDISGAANVKGLNTITAKDFTLELSGAGKADFDIDVESLSVEVSGAGDLDLNGKADRQRVKLSGAGSYNAGNLVAQSVFIKASGAGSAKVFAEKEIEAYASGAGSIRYKGNPEKTMIDSSAAGSVSKD